MSHRDTRVAINKLLLRIKMATLCFGYLLAMHRDYFITMDTIADKIVYQVVFSNLLRNLSILLDIFNLALVISPSWGSHNIGSLTPPDTVCCSWS